MLPFPFCGITNDDLPPWFKDVFGNDPMGLFESLDKEMENAKNSKRVDVNKLKFTRDAFKRFVKILEKHGKETDDGHKIIEELNTAIYDAERNRH